MDEIERRHLEEAGFTVGTVEEFLGLTPEESALIEIKLALSSGLRKSRKDAGMSQVDLAERIGSSQSRIVKAEKGDVSVSIDLLMRALLAAGVSRADVGRIVGSIPAPSSSSTQIAETLSTAA